MIARLLLILATLVMLAACGPQAVAQTATQTKTVNDLTVTITYPEGAKVNQNQQIAITITDAQGQPVENAQVYLDLTMPAHAMGVNQPLAMHQGNGVYRADAVYTMDGDWAVSVTATIDGVVTTAIFNTQVTP
jgi:nitrogen fixation protein FixH